MFKLYLTLIYLKKSFKSQVRSNIYIFKLYPFKYIKGQLHFSRQVLQKSKSHVAGDRLIAFLINILPLPWGPFGVARVGCKGVSLVSTLEGTLPSNLSLPQPFLTHTGGKNVLKYYSNTTVIK